MFANSHQSGFVSIFFSVGSNPLALWDKQVKNGHIRRVIDDEVKSLVLDIGGTNVATTYITCPIKPRASLGVKLPYFVMIIKNMKKYFSFEIQILDDKDMRRRFRVSNFQSTTKVRPFCTTMPIGLSAGWNQVQFNLADFTKRAYGSAYMETVRVQIHANVRIRRIYFTDQLHSDEDLPNEFKLFAPGPRDAKVKGKEKDKKKDAASAEPPPEEAVPPIKVEPKPEEEVPPPPSPAEESPVREEAVEEPPSSPEGEVSPHEGEAPESEAPPTEEATEAPKPEEKAEGEAKPAAEGGEPPAEAEEAAPVEAAAEGEAIEVAAPPTEGGEAVDKGEEAAKESEAPAEGEAPVEEESEQAPAEPPKGEAPPEETTEVTVTETVETTEETTEVTTDVEVSPSEPATAEEEAA